MCFVCGVETSCILTEPPVFCLKPEDTSRLGWAGYSGLDCDSPNLDEFGFMQKGSFHLLKIGKMLVSKYVRKDLLN